MTRKGPRICLTVLFTKLPASKFPAIPWFDWYNSTVPLKMSHRLWMGARTPGCFVNSAVKVPCAQIWPEKSKRECSKWPIVICHAWYAIRWFKVVKLCRKSKNLNIAFDFLVGSLHNYLEAFIFALLKLDDCSSFHLIATILQWNLQGILKRMLFIGRFGPEADTPTPSPHAGRYGQQAGGTHPTGMHTRFHAIFSKKLAK